MQSGSVSIKQLLLEMQICCVSVYCCYHLCSYSVTQEKSAHA